MAQAAEDAIKISIEATTAFVQSFYPALQSARDTIASFYAPNPVLSKLLFNGNIVADGPSVQEIFTNQMPPTRYDIQSYDCQIINTNYPALPASSSSAVTAASAARNMSILVLVNGSVRFGVEVEPGDSTNRRFSETFVLVPNAQAAAASAAAAGGAPKEREQEKRWLIQSQNFRLVG
ncbi:nuclear transport factor 2 domain-containing protein [Histoplasma ohiense]|nr:nuclear transport factor 2 domain-containing protein [Histoplasma ohiense (nom. inval.)]